MYQSDLEPVRVQLREVSRCHAVSPTLTLVARQLELIQQMHAQIADLESQLDSLEATLWDMLDNGELREFTSALGKLYEHSASMGRAQVGMRPLRAG